jgi:hypothetical protein
MTWPTTASKANLDQSSDDPKQARSDLATLVDKFNNVVGHVSALGQTLIAITTQASFRSGIGLGSAAVENVQATGVGDLLREDGDGSGLTGVSPEIASQAEAEAGTENTKMMTALRSAQAIAALASGLRGMQVFTSGSGATYTPTAGATSVIVEVIGGGGGSGSANNGINSPGGGGGGYARKYYALTGAATGTYTVGAAGAAGSIGDGGAGGATSFTWNGVTVTANGGSGSVRGTTSPHAGGAGGAGSGGDVNVTGTTGDPASNDGGGGFNAGGKGGQAAILSGGGARNFTGNTAGNAGTGYGAGGGGSNNASIGGNGIGGAAGSAGLIIVWEF